MHWLKINRGQLVFIASEEGGQFSPTQLPIRGKPQKVIQTMETNLFPRIVIFPCGMIWDSFLPDYLGTKWRHKLDGGRREGKKYYKIALTHFEESR
jgi:hypothetical protein